MAGQAALRAIKVKKAFDFGEATFGRAYGDVACQAFASSVKTQVQASIICQFTGPTWLDVQTHSQHAVFATGGHPATVAIWNGRPRCTLGAHLRPGLETP